MSLEIRVEAKLKAIKLDGNKPAGQQLKALRESMKAKQSTVCKHAGLESSYGHGVEATVSITPIMLAYAKAMGAEFIIIDLKNVKPWQGQTIPTT